MEGKAKFIFPVLMGGMMAFFMTAIITMINFGGIPDGFIGKWMKAFIIAWPLAALAAFVAGPFARRWTGTIVAALDRKR
ncbi:MAG: DUF2798 domain-containing protein [Beijerinckiaceae bacterium]